MIIYYSSHHTDRTIVNESEGEPEDEMRTEQFVCYEIILNNTYNVYNINATIITDHYYYSLFSYANREDYYFPYNTTEIRETHISLEKYPYCLDRCDILKEIQKARDTVNHFKEEVMMELLEKALHPDRIEWIF